MRGVISKYSAISGYLYKAVHPISREVLLIRWGPPPYDVCACVNKYGYYDPAFKFDDDRYDLIPMDKEDVLKFLEHEGVYNLQKKRGYIKSEPTDNYSIYN